MHGFMSILPMKMAIYVTSILVLLLSPGLFHFSALNGAHANVVLSGRQFLIQSNWLNAGGGGCAMGFNSQTPSGLTFVPVTPCRVADTRNPAGAFGGPALAAQSTRGFTIPSSACNIPATAQAYSVNATVVPHGPLGFLTVFPCGQPLPLASTLNAIDGRVKAAAAIVPAGTNGDLCFFTTSDTELVLDINGYFVPNSSPTALAFFPVTPCRVVDTRLAAESLGGPSLAAQQFTDVSDPFQSLQSAGDGASLFHEFHGRSPGSAGFFDYMAGRTDSATRLNIECKSWRHYREFRYSAGWNERRYFGVCLQSLRCGHRRKRLFCTTRSRWPLAFAINAVPSAGHKNFACPPTNGHPV